MELKKINDDKHVLARDLVAEYERHYGQRPADTSNKPAILRKRGRPRKAPNATDITNWPYEGFRKSKSIDHWSLFMGEFC